MSPIQTIILCYFVGINCLSLILFGLDKWKSRQKRWRIPESTLFLLSFLGGSLGAWCGMRLFRHKTLHKKFSIGLPLILLIQLGVISFWWFSVF
ncbi:MAG: DUF1294 domain-containing protein [Porphyromonas sp.]|nr:DUF1294 domain-containing protein [Porphyromonas sp.]